MKTLISCVFFIFISTGLGKAHEDSAPFSGAISEPIKVHHAHIEDEQSINFSFYDNFQKEEGGEKRPGFEASLEIATAWNDDFNLGSELLIPFSDTGNDDNRYALGDVEIWPIKYAFLNKPETILTGVMSIGLPTGNKKHGFGEEQTKLGALLFLDQSWRNWFFGANAEFESALYGPTESEVEFAFALSYSFINQTGRGIAPSKPDQSIVPILSLELISENILSGLEKQNDILTILPGIQLWSPASGWQVSLGGEVPLSSFKDNDFQIHFKLRNHIDWGHLLN
jgi:hypothetical protein